MNMTVNLGYLMFLELGQELWRRQTEAVMDVLASLSRTSVVLTRFLRTPIILT